jgi:methylphosphotriester-DNA--protein-cysteine methyltransferase
MGAVLDLEACCRAMSSRDPLFDGRFVVAVSSIGDLPPADLPFADA